MKPAFLALMFTVGLGSQGFAQAPVGAAVAAPLFAVTGNLGSGYAAPGLGAMGWNYTSGQAEVDFFNNVSAAPQSFAWYQAQSNGSFGALARLGAEGTFTVTPVTPITGHDEITLGRHPNYPENNQTLSDRFANGITMRNGALYMYRDTYGTFGQAVVASIIANSRGNAMPGITGYGLPAEAGPGGERGSAGLYVENNAPAALNISGAAFDATHVFLPRGSALSKAQIDLYARPGSFVETYTRGPQVGPFSGQVVSVSDDGLTVTVTGWWLRADASPGQNPTALVGQLPPYVVSFGVINTIWGQDTNVSLTKESLATSAFVYEAGAFNRTGAFVAGPLSNPMSDHPIVSGVQIGNTAGDAKAGTSTGFWAFGANWRRGFTASGIADDGAGFVYGEMATSGTAFYSAQTAGAFLSLNPRDGDAVFSVTARGDLRARSLAVGAVPSSPRGLSAGMIWANPSTHALYIVP